MREIQIKVWDKEKKTMSPLMPLPMLAGYLSTIYPNLGNEIYLESLGLKDKNAKYICDADIVVRTVPGFAPIKFLVHWDELNAAYFASGDFPQNSIRYGMLHSEGEDEIIGNYYENPELL